ncbi:CidA/LrgA family protein [Advenella mimigardefordensis]|uniref:Putative LrgA-like protein n=1 Tax=Advenella mimigardefordensis (strain DSM 17166 / LMG 22922 / DPN7) TaxID=1247726 RepID=W0PDI8_ADVMD|nr:CidA/LrgA family protein [Advenella mimigardefordensis]AHG64811.1 putative LrgA-like protein [Advenella mimigardefordensis DPN7]
MLISLLVIAACYFVGEAVSHVLPLPLPGPIVGLFLLLLVFKLRPALLSLMARHIPTLLSHLALLFLPATVGSMVSYKLLDGYWPAVITAVIVSTALSLLAGVLVFRYADKQH